VVTRTYLMAQAAQSGTLSDTVLSFVHTPFWLSVFAVLFATGVGVLSGVIYIMDLRVDKVSIL
jgi:hypothetical protein